MHQLINQQHTLGIRPRVWEGIREGFERSARVRPQQILVTPALMVCGRCDAPPARGTVRHLLGRLAQREQPHVRHGPGQVLTAKWPVLTYGRTPGFDPKRWTFRCFGLVEREVSWTWAEFQALPQTTMVTDIHCVTTWSKLDTEWRGVTIDALQHLAFRAASRGLDEPKQVVVDAAGYRSRREGWKRLVTFWSEELPRLLGRP